MPPLGGITNKMFAILHRGWGRGKGEGGRERVTLLDGLQHNNVQFIKSEISKYK